MTEKSYKREMAVVLLIYLMIMGWYESISVLEILAWPFMIYVLGAFGLDSYNKQTLPTMSARYTKKELEEK